MLSQQIKISKRWAEYFSSNRENLTNLKFISVDGITKFVYRNEDSLKKVIISEEDSWFILYSYMKLEPIPSRLIKEPELLAEINQRLFFGSFLIKEKRDPESSEKVKFFFFKSYQRCFGIDEDIDELINKHIMEHESIFIPVSEAISENKGVNKSEFLNNLFKVIEDLQNNIVDI